MTPLSHFEHLTDREILISVATSVYEMKGKCDEHHRNIKEIFEKLDHHDMYITELKLGQKYTLAAGIGALLAFIGVIIDWFRR
jgi:hypothetical protein